MAVTSARGMRDFSPREKERRDAVLAVISETYQRHGFEAIETPALEDSAVLHSGMGGDNENSVFRFSSAVWRRVTFPPRLTPQSCLTWGCVLT